MIVSRPRAKSSSVIATAISGSIPSSVDCWRVSYIGHAEKRTDHPLGSSDENGRPAPPPVLSPMIVAPHSRIYFTNSFAALYTPRLVRTTTRFCHRRCVDGDSLCSCISEKSLCPGPLLWRMYPTRISLSVKREARRSAAVSSPPLFDLTSMISPFVGAR